MRVGEAVRHALALLLERGELRDPSVRDVPITVTEVRMSPDLRVASVFVLPLGGARVAEAVAGLNHAAPYLRGQVARAVRLRFAPDLVFHADTSFAAAERVGRLIDRAGSAPGRSEEGGARSDTEDRGE